MLKNLYLPHGKLHCNNAMALMPVADLGALRDSVKPLNYKSETLLLADLAS